MDVLRRFTDYSLRAMVYLALHGREKPVSTKEISTKQQISYQLACKLMQKLQKAGLVESVMGSKGGFILKRDPKTITLLEMVNSIQGPIVLNRCLVDSYSCERGKGCPVHLQLFGLQEKVNEYLSDITLEDLTKGKKKAK
jgi:Rrf2 family protein